MADEIPPMGPEWPRYEQLTDEPSPFRFSTARTQTLVAAVNGNASLSQWRVGDRVKRGDVLVRLPVERMNVEFRRAVGNYHQAYLKMRESADQADGSDEIIRLSLQAAENELKSLASRIRRQVLLAEYDGIIEQIHVLDGELVRAGQPLLRITDTNFLKVQLPIDARTAVIGQKVSFFCSSGRAEAVLVHVDPQARQFGRFKELITDLCDGTFLYDNQSGTASIGELVGLPQYPFALYPEEIVRQLSPAQPEVWMQSPDLELNRIPVEIFGSVGRQEFLLAGPFRSDETPVKIVSPATSETPAQSEPLPLAVLFPRSQPLLNNEQLEAKFPSLCDRIPALPVSSATSGDNSPSSHFEIQPPQDLQGFLRSEDYPLSAASVEGLSGGLGFSSAERPLLEIVLEYFRAEAIRKRLTIRTAKEIQQINPPRSFPEYLEQVHALNDEIVTLLSLFNLNVEQESDIRQRFRLKKMVMLTGSEMKNFLQLTETQSNQLKQMATAYRAQRQSLYEQYLQEQLSLDELKRISEQTHQAFESDLQIVLNPDQKILWASLTADPAAAADQVETTQTDSGAQAEPNANPSSDTADPEEDEQPTRKLGLPPTLQQAESTLTPFLYLGGGVIVVLLLLIGGWWLYKKRKA